jgi:hypothetical protein
MDTISKNSIMFIGLANEYCNLVENSEDFEKEQFVEQMLKILPRIYISASDLELPIYEDSLYIEPRLEEVYYDSVRRNMERILGEDDTVLEAFEEDMKFSDTPIAVSISEYLADIFQDLYNFVHSVKDAPQSHINDFLCVCKENFDAYWGQKLCNALRALHAVKYNSNNY